MAGKLSDLEERLDVLIDAGDETGWAQVARILQEVADGALWSPEHHSFSAWVKAYSQRKGCAESLLWKYVKAGRAYRAAREKMPELPPIEQAQVSAECVATAEKIYGSDVKSIANLLSQVNKGEVKTAEVREMWRAARKVSGVRTSRHDVKPTGKDRSGDAEVTAALTRALARDASTWIWGKETRDEAEARKAANADRAYLTRDAVCVRTLAEFPVRVESADRARRIDLAAVCVENQTTADWMDVTLRGVEVKVSDYDLTRDQKMADYSLFMDYMYLACPLDLVEVASDLVPPEWGLLAYESETDSISVMREPERLDAPRREQALMTACVKLSRRESK